MVRQPLIGQHRNARGPQAEGHGGKVADFERGMRLGGGPERLLHPQMETDIARLEPDTAPRGKRRRLGNFRKAEVGKEGARGILASLRQGKLNMMNGQERPPATLPPLFPNVNRTRKEPIPLSGDIL